MSDRKPITEMIKYKGFNPISRSTLLLNLMLLTTSFYVVSLLIERDKLLTLTNAHTPQSTVVMYVWIFYFLV